ncbi:MAG: translation initiation factor IF-2 [Desulfobacterales bacterium]|nr:translation initiation factor IF-2 [Desulfobacterales bacterium]
MAKIRVYELARDLNMTNKVLIDKMSQIGIAVKSHMSSLDDDAIAQVKEALFGKKAEQIEETRIKPTVIRRRRKVVKKPAEEVEVIAPEPDDAAETPAAADTPAAEPEGAEAQAQPVETEAAELTVAETDAAQPVRPKPQEAVAKIISPPPATPDAEEAAAAATAAETAETAPPADEAAEPQAIPDGQAEEVPAVEAEAAATEAADTTPEKKPAAKVVKKEPAAKIIKLPTKPVEQPARPARPAGVGPAGRTAEMPSPPSAELRKKKRKKKAEEDLDRKFFKKKISFRKKAVVEGADLYDGKGRGRKHRKDAKVKSATAQKTQITTAKAIKRRVKVDEAIVLAELAKRMGIKANEIIKQLMGMGVMATVNQSLDFETATLVAGEFGYEIEKASFEEETLLKVEQDDPAKLAERPPVVTIMGHVDHGKTSLLDVIRQSHVTDTEAGGITQHIGAYSVSTSKGPITFLDTPGHEAFTAMRSRGAQVTDLVVLVVAADDGVMPQTLEAINHSRASEVPIIVAVNKIDKAGAEPDRVMRELAENGLAPEDWGGDTIFVQVSAKEKTGIDDLLEMILLQSEMMELKANAEKLAYGHVVEAKLDSGRGAVATVLVKEGTLKNGDPVVCGIHHGKVRAMLNDMGQPVIEAGPSVPVEVLGLSGVPVAGDELLALKDEKDAKQVSTHRGQKQRVKELARSNRMSLENLFEQMKEGEVKDLNLIIKADVDGSMEALRDSLTKLSNEEVKINIVHSATGTITESDVSLAAVSNAIIIGFNVRPTPKVQGMASDENVDMRYYNVIYDVIKEIKNAIAGMMESTFEERVLGRADVRQVFQIPKVGAIAGCYVTDGRIERGQLLRLLRDGVVHYEGRNSSLRRYKDDAKEVQAGYECGIGIENFNDIKVGDVIECYYLEEIRPEID